MKKGNRVAHRVVALVGIQSTGIRRAKVHIDVNAIVGACFYYLVKFFEEKAHGALVLSQPGFSFHVGLMLDLCRRRNGHTQLKVREKRLWPWQGQEMVHSWAPWLFAVGIE